MPALPQDPRSPQNSVGPDALGVTGPCFAVRETSGMLQMISQRRKRLAFAPAASDVCSSDVSSALPLWHMERRLRFDPSRAGVTLDGPAESWLPRLSAAPYPPARRLRRLDSLALFCDDVMTFSPDRAFCQINFFTYPSIQSGKAKRLFPRRLDRRDRRHVDDAARGHRGGQNMRRLCRADENRPNRQGVGDDPGEL